MIRSTFIHVSSDLNHVLLYHLLNLLFYEGLISLSMLLAVQIKCWAKAQCINDPKLGTLNSYALSLLVVFHLQVSGFLLRKFLVLYSYINTHDLLVVKICASMVVLQIIAPLTLQYRSIG